MSAYRLDVPALHAALDKRRAARGISWRQVARETGLVQSTMARLGQGRTVDADALVALLVWLDMDTDLVWLIQPGDAPIPCPACGRHYRPTQAGVARRHDCKPRQPHEGGHTPA